jgi:hypothetical protein
MNWIPFEEAKPTEGQLALIISEQSYEKGDGALLGDYPQLCVFDDGHWVQCLRGDYYGLGVDGKPKLISFVEMPK